MRCTEESNKSEPSDDLPQWLVDQFEGREVASAQWGRTGAGAGVEVDVDTGIGTDAAAAAGTRLGSEGSGDAASDGHCREPEWTRFQPRLNEDEDNDEAEDLETLLGSLGLRNKVCG